MATASTARASWSQFLRFLAVGGAVGVATLAVREWVALALPGDTPVWYALSSILAYAVGIVASYLLQQRFSFAAVPAHGSPGRFARFVLVAMAGALVAMLASAGLRYGLYMDRWLGDLGASAAFAAGALGAAGASYLLNLKLVFVARAPRID